MAFGRRAGSPIFGGDRVRRSEGDGLGGCGLKYTFARWSLQVLEMCLR